MRNRLLIVVTLLATMIAPAATTAEPDTLAKKTVADNIVVENVNGTFSNQVGLTQTEIAQKQIDENLQKIEEQKKAEEAAAQQAAAAQAAQNAYANQMRAAATAAANTDVAVAYGRARNAEVFGDSEWPALYTIWARESGWRANAINYSSGACGIPQFINGCTLGDYQGQINQGLVYIKSRYGSPSRALAFWNAHHWY